MKKTFALAALVASFAWGLGAGLARATEVSFWTWRQEDKAAYTELFADFTKLKLDPRRAKILVVKSPR